VPASSETEMGESGCFGFLIMAFFVLGEPDHGFGEGVVPGVSSTADGRRDGRVGLAVGNPSGVCWRPRILPAGDLCLGGRAQLGARLVDRLALSLRTNHSPSGVSAVFAVWSAPRHPSCCTGGTLLNPGSRNPGARGAERVSTATR